MASHLAVFSLLLLSVHLVTAAEHEPMFDAYNRMFLEVLPIEKANRYFDLTLEAMDHLKEYVLSNKTTHLPNEDVLAIVEPIKKEMETFIEEVCAEKNVEFFEEYTPARTMAVDHLPSVEVANEFAELQNDAYKKFVKKYK